LAGADPRRSEQFPKSVRPGVEEEVLVTRMCLEEIY
jgi:hypothetical protein